MWFNQKGAYLCIFFTKNLPAYPGSTSVWLTVRANSCNGELIQEKRIINNRKALFCKESRFKEHMIHEICLIATQRQNKRATLIIKIRPNRVR